MFLRFYQLTVIFFVQMLACNVACGMEQTPATSPIKFERVSINLMWVNRVSDMGQPHILDPKFFPKIIKWAKCYPESCVNVWFDAKLVPPNASKATNEHINAIWTASGPARAINIRLRDINEIPIVQANQDVFSQMVVVYFRVDLLRPIVALHMFQNTKEADYFVYADLDMEAPMPTVLFNPITIKTLIDHGILMAQHPREEEEEALGDPTRLNYENSFQIISNHRPELLAAMQEALIDVNIARAKNALARNFSPTPSLPMKALTEAVYHSYQNMFKYLEFLKGTGKLYIIRKLTKLIPEEIKETPKGRIIIPEREKTERVVEEYNKSVHGLEPFDLHCTNNDIKLEYLSHTEIPLHTQQILSLSPMAMQAPVIDVNVPRSRISEYKDLLYKQTYPTSGL